MIRWCRFFSRFDGRNISPMSEPMETVSNRQRTLQTLTNESNYTQDKISRVIRGYFFLHLANKAEQGRDNLGEDPVVQNSIEAMTPFVKNMTIENLMLLIVNASMISVKNSEFWSEVQQAFLRSNGKLLDATNVANVVSAFYKSELRDSELWGLLEEKLIKEIIPQAELEPRAASELVKSFGLSQKGGEVLYEQLMEIITTNIDIVSAVDISKLLLVHAKMRHIEPEIFRVLLDRFIVVCDQAFPFVFSQVFRAALELDAEQKYIDFFEAEAIKRLPTMHLPNFALLVSGYGRYRCGDGKDIGINAKFLGQIEEFYAQNREKLLTGRTEFYIVTETKIFWGFAKAGVFGQPQLWKRFAADKKKSTVTHKGNYIQQYIIEIDEFMKAKGIIST